MGMEGKTQAPGRGPPLVGDPMLFAADGRGTNRQTRRRKLEDGFVVNRPSTICAAQGTLHLVPGDSRRAIRSGS